MQDTDKERRMEAAWRLTAAASRQPAVQPSSSHLRTFTIFKMLLAACDASFAPSTPIVLRMGKLCTVFSTFAHTHAHGT